MFSRRGQSTAEYAIIIGVVVGAIMGVGVFLRGGIEGKVRHMTNKYLDQGETPANFGTAVMSSDYVTGSLSQEKVSEVAGTTKTEILVGGGTKAGAETMGKTTRKGSTTYFETEETPPEGE